MSLNLDSIPYFKFTAVNSQTPVQETVVSPDETLWTHPDFPDVSVRRTFFRGGPSDGVELFTLTNENLAVHVLPTRGMGIWRVDVKKNVAENVRVGWNSPVPRPVNPRNVPLDQADGLGWLRGFNEFVARCGLESNGAPEFNENGTLRWPLHGRLQNTPAHLVELTFDALRKEFVLTGVVHEGRLFFNDLHFRSSLRLPFFGRTFFVEDVVRNFSARPAEFELLYHVNTGQPVADEGATMEIPFRRLVPRCPWAAQNLKTVRELHKPVVGEPEMCYFYELSADENGDVETFLKNPNGDFGVALEFNQKEFPYFCQWKAQHAAEDGYVTGMEPCVNFPNTRSFEKARGRVATLAPQESREFHLTFRFCTNKTQVDEELAAVAKLQALCPNPTISPNPTEDWCG